MAFVSLLGSEVLPYLFCPVTAMDTDRFHLASILVHMASTFGFITNLIAIVTIKKCVNLHTSFGILCASLATSNSAVVLVNSLWYLMPAYEILKDGSIISRTVEMSTLALWIVGVRLHLFISINRLISIAFPFKIQKYATPRSTTITKDVAFFLAFLECSPFVWMTDAWFCFNGKFMLWNFAPTKFGIFYQQKVIYLVEFGGILIIDVVTLIHLRIAHTRNTVPPSNESSTVTRAVEIRLFKQAFSQSIPLLGTFLCFAFVTPALDSDFGKFFTTTFMWHLSHGVDGLIIDLFHTRLELFRKRINETTAITTSYAPTATIHSLPAV